MALFEGINRMQTLHTLIANETTGTPCQLADRFHLSKRQLYNLLEEFREMGAEIAFKVSVLTPIEEKVIYAGENQYRAILLHGRTVSLLL